MPKVPGHGAGGAASCVTAQLLECDAGIVKLITHETSLGLAEDNLSTATWRRVGLLLRLLMVTKAEHEVLS